MPATVRDIAALCHVSPATVSRALNGRDCVRPVTRDKILRAAREHGYIPFRNSGLLNAQREASLAVFLSRGFAAAVDNPFYSLALSPVLDEMEKCNGAVTLPCTGSLAELRTLPLALSALRGVDGILVLFHSLSQAECEGLSQAGLPYVVVGEKPAATDAASVCFDVAAGAGLAVRHLAELGHRSIGYWGWRSADSVRGFREGLTDCGLAVDEDWVVTPRRRFDREDWDEMFDWGLLRARDLPTAFFCNNDVVAAQFIRRAGKLGITVPTDLSVVGFDDLPLAAMHEPPLTTVRQPVREMALRGVRHLLATIGGERRLVRETLAPKLVVRASTATVLVGDALQAALTKA